MIVAGRHWAVWDASGRFVADGYAPSYLRAWVIATGRRIIASFNI